MPAADGRQVLLGDPQPGAGRAGEGPGLSVSGVLALVVGGLALAAGGAAILKQRLDRATLRRSLRRAEAERTARLAVLEADPVRVPYAARIRAGEAWSDAQIAYDLDPHASAVCEHLRPIEQAMRADGVAVKLERQKIVDAACVLAQARFHARGWPPPEVNYVERQADGRSAEDPWFGLLGCTTCLSAIQLRSPRDRPPGTPLWPTR